MAVPVSLKSLVALADSRPLWPAEFESLVTRIEQKPADRVGFGVVADWLDEHDEPAFAAAWRWLMNRDQVVAYHANARTAVAYWSLRGTPESLPPPDPDPVPRTLAHRVAILADQLGKARADLERRKAELEA